MLLKVKYKSVYNDRNSLKTSFKYVYLYIFLILVVLLKNSSGDLPNQSSSSLMAGWSMKAVPHQNNAGFSTIFDQIKNLKYSWESTVDSLVRKIENLEMKIARLETSNQVRLEKLHDAINSKEIKDELGVDQLTRKIDLNYEKLNHKFGLMETRVETSLTKIQMALDSGLAGLNRIEAHQTEMDSDLTEISQSVEEIKLLTQQMDDKNNLIQQKYAQQNIQTILSDSRDQIQKLTGTVKDISKKINETSYTLSSLNQMDASSPPFDADKLLQTVKTGIEHEGVRIEKKINNMYNDLWMRLISLEGTIKTIHNNENATCKLLQDELRNTMQIYERQRNTEPDSQESYVEILIDATMKKIQELRKNMDSKFHEVFERSHDQFNEDYRQMQYETEAKLKIIFEKILITISNKTSRIDNRLVETMELVKSHQSQVMRSLGHSTKLLVMIDEDLSKSSKNIESGLVELGEKNAISAAIIEELKEDLDFLTNITMVKLYSYNDYEDWSTKPQTRNEEPSNRSDEDQTSSELFGEPGPPSVELFSKNHNDYGSDKNIKPKNLDEVVKILTDDENTKYTYNSYEKQNSDEKGKRISFIVPDTFFENNKEIDKNKLYKTLLIDIFNHTDESLNGNRDDIGAIVLNTETDKKGIDNNKKYNIDELYTMNNKETYLADNLDKKTQKLVEEPYLNKTTLLGNDTNKDIENYNTKIPNNLKVINITKEIKTKYDEHKNQRNKLINKNNLKKFLELNRKRQKLSNKIHTYTPIKMSSISQFLNKTINDDINFESKNAQNFSLLNNKNPNLNNTDKSPTPNTNSSSYYDKFETKNITAQIKFINISQERENGNDIFNTSLKGYENSEITTEKIILKPNQNVTEIRNLTNNNNDDIFKVPAATPTIIKQITINKNPNVNYTKELNSTLKDNFERNSTKLTDKPILPIIEEENTPELIRIIRNNTQIKTNSNDTKELIQTKTVANKTQEDKTESLLKIENSTLYNINENTTQQNEIRDIQDDIKLNNDNKSTILTLEVKSSPLKEEKLFNNINNNESHQHILLYSANVTNKPFTTDLTSNQSETSTNIANITDLYLPKFEKLKENSTNETQKCLNNTGYILLSNNTLNKITETTNEYEPTVNNYTVSNHIIEPLMNNESSTWEIDHLSNEEPDPQLVENNQNMNAALIEQDWPGIYDE